MNSLLDRLLAPGALDAAFQPVVDLRPGRPRVLYFEGLLRPSLPGELTRPELLFSYARRKRAEATLDRVAIETVLAAARALPGGACVGVNLHATTLAQDLELPTRLLEIAQRHALGPERLVVEIVEHGLPRRLQALAEPLAALRAVGVRVALDDVGTGLSNLNMLLACSPALVKLDGQFAHGVANDHGRRAVVATMARLARSLGADLVAEGVEEIADFEALRDLGVGLMQGYLLGRPAPASRIAARPLNEGVA